MSIVLQGSTSGSVTLQEPAVAGTTVLTLPAVTGNVLTDTSPKAGNVIQVVSTTKTDVFSTASTSFVDITGMSLSITPSSSSNKILVIASMCLGGTTFSINQFRLMRNSTAIAVPSDGTYQFTGAFYTEAGSNASSAINSPVGTILDSPATTSATTYKVQLQTNGSTVYINRRGEDANFRGVSTLTIMEIAA